METASAENDEVLQRNGTACLQQPSSLLLLFQAAQRAATDSGKVSVPIQLSTGSLTQARNGWQIQTSETQPSAPRHLRHREEYHPFTIHEKKNTMPYLEMRCII